MGHRPPSLAGLRVSLLLPAVAAIALAQPTLRIETPMAPPAWALLERELLTRQLGRL